MKRLFLILAAVVMVAGLMCIVGCSDDDNKPTGPTPGNPNNSEFLLMKDLMGEGYASLDGNIIDLSLEMMDSIPDKTSSYNPFKPTAGASLFDSLVFSYTYSNFWHVFSLTAVMYTEGDDPLLVDTLTFQGVDSLRFWNASGMMQYPDTTTTTINIRAHVTMDISGQSGQAGIESDASYDLTGGPHVGLNINGAASHFMYLSAVTDTSSLHAEIDAGHTATNIYFDSTALANDDCPVSGRLAAAASIDLDYISPSDTVMIAGGWSVLFVYNDGEVTITYTHGTNYWVVTEPCGSGLSKAGWAGLRNRIMPLAE